MDTKPPYQEISDEAINEISSEYYDSRAALTTPQEKPTAILVGGQPGAGKTAAAGVARSDLLNKGGYIHVDADRMREELPIPPGVYSSEKTQADASRLVKALRNKATQNQRNIVEEGTFRNPEGVETFAKSLREKGYSPELVAVSTSKEHSLLGIYERYERQIEQGSTNPRILTEDYHQQAYDGFNSTVEQKESTFSRVRVVNRSGELLYDTESTNNRNKTAFEALQEGQKLKPEQLPDLKAGWEKVRDAAVARGETNQDYLAKVENNLQRITQMHKALIFTREEKSTVLDQYPDLKQAYEAMEETQKNVLKDNLSSEQQAVVMQRVQSNLAHAIETGQYKPSEQVAGKEKIAVPPTRDSERDIER